MKFFHHQRYSEFMQTYAAIAGTPAVTKDQYRRVNLIELLEKFVHHDEYYTVFNLPTQSFTWNLSVDTYLEYDNRIKDNAYLTKLMPGLVHPFIADWANIFTAGLYKCIFERKFDQLDYLKFRFVINLPVRKENGTYMLVKQIMMPFEFDSNDLMVSTISSYFIVDRYKGEALNPRIFHLNERREDYEKLLFQESLYFANLTPKNALSEKYMQLVKKILNLPEKQKSNLNKTVLSKASGRTTKRPDYKKKQRLKDKLLPLIDYNPAIKGSVHESWLPDFTDTWRLIHFLNDSGILPLLQLLKEENDATQ